MNLIKVINTETVATLEIKESEALIIRRALADRNTIDNAYGMDQEEVSKIRSLIAQLDEVFDL